MDAVDLPECWDNHDKHVIADILDDVRHGDDGAPSRAAARLRRNVRRRECPFCDGTGEME